MCMGIKQESFIRTHTTLAHQPAVDGTIPHHTTLMTTMHVDPSIMHCNATLARQKDTRQ